MAKNDNLHKAKDAKNDEFYTRIDDVAEELRHYKKHFAGKVVLCNCDDPTWSAFWRYFHLNFAELGLKKLISTHYDRTEPTYKMEYEGGDDNNVEVGVKTPLEGNGDFRNKECLDLLDESDIVVTNPPFSLLEVTAKTDKKAIFKCPDCGKEFKAQIGSVVDSVNNGFTGCYDCMMRRVNAISKPEWFYTRPMLAFAGENGIANPFFDVRNILGENSLLGLDFVDHIQRLIYEYNGKYPHADAAEKDRFKFEAVRKAGYKGIRVLEPGLEVLGQKYDIVMPEGFRDSGGRYNAEIMEEVGRKVIHLLEEIYGRKASPEIWALNNFKEFEIWYDANKKELEANARKKGPKGKTAAKMAA